MKISFILNSRNNLKYLKWSYNSIRKNQGDHTVQICVADDFSDDGTWDWCQLKMKTDSEFTAIRNNGPKRIGITGLCDKLVNDIAIHDICIQFHADMYLCPDALDEVEKYIKDKVIVSLTRIEPPLHPAGPEKILKDFGTEPEDFNEADLLGFLNTWHQEKNTEGIFAPWAFFKKDYQEVNGHDELFAPQSKEDSDIFNRFQLNGVNFIQTWKGFVYHLTSRGSRFNPKETVGYIDSAEWKYTNQKNTRNFIRKWGHFVKHDQFMKPIIPPKYDITFIPENCNRVEQLSALEPWCTKIYIDNPAVKRKYIESEQKDTLFDLSKKIIVDEADLTGDIRVRFDMNRLIQQEQFNFLMQLPEILQESAELGSMEYDIYDVEINSLDTYEDQLIVNGKEYYKKDIYILETVNE